MEVPLYVRSARLNQIHMQTLSITVGKEGQYKNLLYILITNNIQKKMVKKREAGQEMKNNYTKQLCFFTHIDIQVIKLVVSSLTWTSCSSGSLFTAVVWTAGVNTLVVTRSL